jgi:hypothetical protein
LEVAMKRETDVVENSGLVGAVKCKTFWEEFYFS